MSRSGMMLLVVMAAAVISLPAAGAGARGIDMETRIAAQAAIEGVAWNHRIWPAGNPNPKPMLSDVMPEAALRAAVENSLLESRALDRIWGRPIRAADLRAEIERMAATSRAPGILREIFTALGNDPVLVAECLARPILADRLLREAYAGDPRLHQELKSAIEQSLLRGPSIAELRRGAEYAEAEWVHGGRSERGAKRAGARVIPMNDDAWRRGLARLGDRPVGSPGPLQEDGERFFVQAVLEKSGARVRVATVAWPKKPFDAWWAEASAALALSDDDGAAVGTIASDAALPALAPNACTSDTWAAVQTSGAPSARESFSAVWTGTEMIVWGGYNGTTNLDTNTGGRYNPATNSWTATSTTNAPVLRDSHVAVWTGTRMVLWGGGDEVFNAKNTGGRYDPATNGWQATTTTGAAAARLYHTAVWTGAKMIVWGGWAGGTNGRDMDTGGQYDPAADAWTATTRTGAPSSRDTHVAVWSGSRMVVWGGQDDNAVAQGTGGRYDPVGNAWTATTLTNAPVARWMHTGLWTGSRLIVWGGFDGTVDLNDGSLYDPAADTWTPTSTTGAPAARELHVAVWADAVPEMIVWGGQDDAVNPLTSGGRYNPATGAWAATSTTGVPPSGRYGAAVWTGTEMIVWGGWSTASNPDADLNVGGRYCDGGCSSPAPGGGSTVSVAGQPGAETVSWTALAGADRYDVVRGSLTLLGSSGGNFTTATQACLANDQAGVSFLDATLPAAGDGFFYLVRGISCGGAGTYDSGAVSQVGSRDAEIAASASACP
jgi:hypothetical protein